VNYLAQIQPPLIEAFDVVATAPRGVSLLRELIASLAIRGALCTQSAADASAETLLERIKKEREQLPGKARRNSTSTSNAVNKATTPFRLPRTWRWARFQDVILDSEAGWSPNCEASPRSAGSWGVLKVSAVSWGEFRGWENKQLPADLPPRPQFEVRPGDFLISRANTAELVARSVVVGIPEPQLLLSDKIIRLRLSEHADPRFFNVVNNAADARNHYAVKASGTSSSMKNVSRDVILELPVPIPPLAEQHRIVARVDELMKLCDALEQNGRLADEQHEQLVSTLFDALADSDSAHALAQNWVRVAEHFDVLFDRPEAIDALEQTVLQLAVRGLLVAQVPQDDSAESLLSRIRSERSRLFSSGLAKRGRDLIPVREDEKAFALPPQWVWVRFDDLVRADKPIAYGVLVPGPDVPDGIPFVRLGDLSLDRPQAQPEKAISPEVDAQFARTRLEGGEILLGVVGSIGKLGVAPPTWKGANIARAVSRIVPTSLVDKEFVLALLQSRFMRERFLGDTRTLAQPTLNIGLIRECPTPLPPLAEQRRIVARVDELRQLCAELRGKLTEAQSTQTSLANALTAAAGEQLEYTTAAGATSGPD
jgi:type I restriction enzyme S subunit